MSERPNAFSSSEEADNMYPSSGSATNDHFEQLLVNATIVSTMGNIHSSQEEQQETPPQSPTSSAVSVSSQQARIRQLCSLSTFLLGGPMPPTPGLIPLCWEELLDWADDASALAVVVHQRNTAISQQVCGSKETAEPCIPVHVGIRFVPYVSVHETDEALKKLASQSYMERAQFYQESVLIAVEDVQEGGILCLTTLFQFCRYYTLLRRLADSQEMVLDYPVEGATLEARTEECSSKEQSPADSLNEPAATSSYDEEEPSTLPLVGLQHTGIDEASTISAAEPQLNECAICFDKTEEAVLNCCSHALCSDCERRWVRKRLRCPFCRQSFASVKEVVQTQWQLSVTAIPLDQVLEDVRSLETKIGTFWHRLLHEKDRNSLASILAENYVQRPKAIQSCAVEAEGDEFVVIEELSLSCAVPVAG